MYRKIIILYFNCSRLITLFSLLIATAPATATTPASAPAAATATTIATATASTAATTHISYLKSNTSYLISQI